VGGKDQDTVQTLTAQRGPQEAFLATSADIAVYGGAAGSGKTYAMLLEPLRHVHVPGFNAVIFRRTNPQIIRPGGLWDTSHEVYRPLGGEAKQNPRGWTFPSGAKIEFAHMQHEDDRFDWDGAQIAYVAFDQLEHFTWKQFVYLMSRNRSTCGVRPYIRATCNPDPDHWLRRWISWWVDEATGAPIMERSGVIRWYVLRDDEPRWADTREELVRELGPGVLPKSFTFIAGNVFDNKILLDKDPGYLANLQALPLVERERLLGGNWNIRAEAGMFFRRDWWKVVEAAPGGWVAACRYWDRAATKREGKDTGDRGPSSTAGVKMYKYANGLYCVAHVHTMYGSPLTVRQSIRNLAEQDGHDVSVGIEQDPGQAGTAEAQDQIRNLAGFKAHTNKVREDKGRRAGPFSAQVEVGNVLVVRDRIWNEPYFKETENFDGSKKCKSDMTDASSGAFHMLTRPVKVASTW